MENLLNMKQALSDEIRETRQSVIYNNHQGTDNKVLFICSMGILRSATAARIYAKKYNTRCAGTAIDALIPITQLLINWADQLVFVSKENYDTACLGFNQNTFDYKSKLLDIPDMYPHMHKNLIKAFKTQYELTTQIIGQKQDKK